MSTYFSDEEGKPVSIGAGRPKASKPASPPADKPMDAPTTKTEVERAFCSVYNLGHKLLHDDVRYRPTDFAEEADGVVELMQQHAALRVVMRFLGPIAAIGAIIEKVDDTVRRWKDRSLFERQQKEAANSLPPNAVNVETHNGTVAMAGGLTDSDVKGRPFGR